jgi:hypothetical protein
MKPTLLAYTGRFRFRAAYWVQGVRMYQRRLATRLVRASMSVVTLMLERGINYSLTGMVCTEPWQWVKIWECPEVSISPDWNVVVCSCPNGFVIQALCKPFW